MLGRNLDNYQLYNKTTTAFPLTVNPLERVVLSVLIDVSTGVAKPLLLGWTARMAARLRSAWLRFKASLREAMTSKGASSDPRFTLQAA